MGELLAMRLTFIFVFLLLHFEEVGHNTLNSSQNDHAWILMVPVAHLFWKSTMQLASLACKGGVGLGCGHDQQLAVLTFNLLTFAC